MDGKRPVRSAAEGEPHRPGIPGRPVCAPEAMAYASYRRPPRPPARAAAGAGSEGFAMVTRGLLVTAAKGLGACALAAGLLWPVVEACRPRTGRAVVHV